MITPGGTQAPPPLDEAVDHVRGPMGRPVILEYGDYECPYSRAAYRRIQNLERQVPGGIRFVFRHFPLTEMHPHALAAAAAAEAAALQGEFWAMSGMLFHGQKALEEVDLRRYATKLGLDVDRFDRDRASGTVLAHIRRDAAGGRAAQVRGTPTLFVDGIRHEGAYDVASLRLVAGV